MEIAFGFRDLKIEYYKGKVGDAYDGILEGYRELIKEYSVLIREHFNEVNRLVTLFAEFLEELEGGRSIG